MSADAQSNLTDTVYEENTSVLKEVALESFIKAILPLLHDYGVPETRQETYLYQSAAGVVISRTEEIGNSQSAHLRHDFSDNYSLGGDGYSGSHGYKKLQGINLIHGVSGRKLELSIEIELLTYTDDQLRLYLAGEASEVEKFKQALQSPLENCRKKYVPTDLPTDKMLRMTVKFRPGYFDSGKNKFMRLNVMKTDYFFKVPPNWVAEPGLIQEKENLLLEFITKRKFDFPDSNQKLEFELVEFEKSFLSRKNCQQLRPKAVFVVTADGQIFESTLPVF